MRYIGLVLIGLFSCCSSAEQLEGEMELGVGLGGQYIHDYRGSKETQVQFLPFPFVKYQGDFLKVDRRGAVGEIYKTKHVEFNLSADLALNGGSDDNPLRQGMPSLSSAVQLGPQLNINLSGKNFSEGLSLRMPLRAVVAIDSKKVEHIGFNFGPKLTYRVPGIWKGWDAKWDVGVLYGSEQYHDYYYTVAPEFATEERPVYEAEAGYSGVFAKVGAKARYGNFVYGVSLRYDDLNGVSFKDSPLMETDSHWVMSAGVAWVFYKRNQ